MMTFRKLAAASSGKLIRAYFTEGTPEPEPETQPVAGPYLDSGGRLTSYYTRRDSRATWRPDMPAAVAAAMGIDPALLPKDTELERLFEAKNAATGEGWSAHQRKVSAYDLTTAPHKSVTLAAEFASSEAEGAMIRHALDRANDATMRYVAREIGWARKGHGGEEGAEPGAVGWVSFRHHNARPTLQVQDGQTGVTYLADLPVPGDPHDHIHNGFFNLVVTADGRVGSLDTKRLNDRVHEFGAYYQAQLADELRRLGIRVEYDAKQEAVMLSAVPKAAVDAFSKGRRQTERNAKRFAKDQGLDWEAMTAERKFGMLAAAATVERQSKTDTRTDREVWREQAAAIGWEHRTVLEGAVAPVLADQERLDRAYEFAAKQLAAEFHTAAVLTQDKVRTFAARGLIGVGISGGAADIDRVMELIEARGLTIRGEHAALITGVIDEKVKMTNTAQVRIEETLASRAKVAARDRSGALSEAAITAAINASSLDFTRDPEHGRAQKAAIYALGMTGNLTFLTGVAGAGKSTLLQPLVTAYQADTTFSQAGRNVIGISTAWKAADALKDAGIKKTVAVEPFMRSVEDGSIALSRNTVLVIDEVSQVGPRSMLRFLELQAEYGFAIKGLGDQEQCQAIEAGDTIEIMRRSLPKEALPELLTTVRQETKRGREIAGLFRDGNAAEALAMKREDGTARLIGGDQDQVIDRIADLYMERRDVLRAAGSARGVTVSALTNEDAGDISRAIRAKMKQRGEIGSDEREFAAISQTKATYDLQLAPGDKVRLFRKTSARIDGKRVDIGANGDVVEIVRWTPGGVVLRDKHGREGDVEWKRLIDIKTDRLLLAYGHALTVDSAQGITSGEHINAMPRGTAGATSFKSYVAESRHVTQVYTMIAEAAVFEAVKYRRALGDLTPVTTDDLWARVAEDMSDKRYKALGMDLANGTRRSHEATIEAFMATDYRLDSMKAAGRKPGVEARTRIRAEADRKAVRKQIVALDEALVRNGAAVGRLGHEVEAFLTNMRDQTAELARRGIEAARFREKREQEKPAPSFSPRPY